MSVLTAGGNSVLYITQGVTVANKKTVPFYGTVTDADNYFFAHPQYHLWNEQTQEDKWRFLVGATRILDRLNYVGQKAEDDQPLQFPRCGSTEVPVPIVQAVYEIALKLADGFDPDTEARNLSVTSQGYAGSKTNYAREFVPDYARAGIPSQGAWLLLYPYLRDPNQLTVLRNS
jgi:hypothetical protein